MKLQINCPPYSQPFVSFTDENKKIPSYIMKDFTVHLISDLKAVYHNRHTAVVINIGISLLKFMDNGIGAEIFIALYTGLSAFSHLFKINIMHYHHIFMKKINQLFRVTFHPFIIQVLHELPYLICHFPASIFPSQHPISMTFSSFHSYFFSVIFFPFPAVPVLMIFFNRSSLSFVICFSLEANSFFFSFLLLNKILITAALPPVEG